MADSPSHVPEDRAARKARRRRALARSVRLPLVSGKTSAAVLALCFVLAVVIVFILGRRSPVWVRSEMMLAAWWLIWTITLVNFLYHGRRVSDDYALRPPRHWFGSSSKRVSNSSSGGGGSWDFVNVGLEGIEFEGCLILIGIILALIVAFAGLWLLIEVAVPGLAFVAYFLIQSMLARVANDQHACQGNFARALGWGAMWSTVYVAPLALLVWLAHVLTEIKAGDG